MIGLNGIRGDLQFSEKSKKEKVRSLSAVAKELSSYQMGCHLSHKPNGSPSSAKRFKLPRKVSTYSLLFFSEIISMEFFFFNIKSWP